MSWHKEMLRGFRDNAAYEGGRYLILALLAAVWPTINGILHICLEKPWYWKLNGGLIVLTAILLVVSVKKFVQTAHTSKEGLSVASRVRSMMILVILIGAIIGGTLAGVGWWIIKNPPATVAKFPIVQPPIVQPESELSSVLPPPASLLDDPSPRSAPESDEIPNIHDQYLKDFKGMKFGNNSELRSPDGAVAVTINFQVHLNYDSQSKFLSVYVPHAPSTYDVCKSLPELYKKFLEDADNVRAEFKIPGDVTVRSSRDLIFTRKIYVYYEDYMTLEQLGSLESLFKAQNLSAHFRGADYATSMWLARKAGANEPQREAGPKNVPPVREATAIERNVFEIFESGTDLDKANRLKQYKDRELMIEGKVMNTRDGPKESTYLAIVQREPRPSIYCTFGPEWAGNVGALRIGQVIKVRGKISSTQSGDVLQLINCELLQ